MQKKPNFPMNADELRSRAEDRLRKREDKQKAEDEGQRTEPDTQRLLHELQVRQIELEMQNDELRSVRNEMEGLLEKYTDLYDFAPVGYFSLDENGSILEVNLTATTLLRMARSELVGKSLLKSIIPENQPVFRSFLKRVFAEPEGQSCEAALVKADGTAFWASFNGSSAFYAKTAHNWCRVAVSDITDQKLAEEAQHRLDTMTIKKMGLEKEILQRKGAEEELRQSQQQTTELLHQSLHQQEQLRSLSRRVLTVQEEERKRISRELHDEITQTLVGISVHLESLSQEAALKPKDLRKIIAQTQKQVEQAVEIAHRFARELRPPVLDDLGLIPALEASLKTFMKDTGIRVALKAFAGVEKLDIEKRTTLYRVAQEAVANVARHAKASRVGITINKLPHAVHMYITDNGCAFKVDQLLHSEKKMPLGLLGMRERMEMVGGTLSVISTPAEGTTIHAMIPDEPEPGRHPGP